MTAAATAPSDPATSGPETDALTGLPGREEFAERVSEATRRGAASAVLCIDLDRFALVNDTLGHAAGDTLLVGVADRLRDALRGADTAARLGGDEFAVLLVDIEPEHVSIVADRITRRLAAPCAVGPVELPIRACLGVAVAESGSITGEELVREADAAMYVRKHSRPPGRRR